MTGADEVQVREARPGDVDGAVEVWRASRAAAGQRPSAAALAAAREALAAPDALLVVGEVGGEVVGLARGAWVRSGGELVEGALELADLIVHPRLRRQGVGGQLAEALADAGYVRGARRLSAWASPAEAAFLEALGLEPSDRERDGRVELAAELDPPMTELAVREGGLRLGQLLKLAGLVETGAEGKALLEAGGAQVNGEVELRRGRQLQDGDVVVARDRAVRVVLPPD